MLENVDKKRLLEIYKNFINNKVFIDSLKLDDYTIIKPNLNSKTSIK